MSRLSIATVGIFPHKPLDTSLVFNSMYHNLHGIMAGVASIVIAIGFIGQGFQTNDKQPFICFYMAGTSTVFPLFILNYQGAYSTGYVSSETWLGLDETPYYFG